MSTVLIPEAESQSSEVTTGGTTERVNHDTTGLTILPALIPQPHGGALRAGGTLGNKGGRPPNEFRARMQALASSDEVETGLQAMIAQPTSPLFLGAVKHVTEHGYGKPTEKHELSGDAKVTVNVVYSHE